MERSFYLLFSQFPGIGPHKFNSLIATFGSAENAANAGFEDLQKAVGKITAEKFIKFKNKFDIRGYEKFLKNKKISYVCLTDKNYPSLLKKIPNPPFLLYVKGDEDLLSQNNLFAIVGTRKITSYGEEATELFSSELSKNFVIVSGMALGVDAYAHKSCIERGGKTIAVLGNGVDLPFPSSNAHLYDQILEKGGTIISEFPPGQPPSIGSFPSRNRIIAGISQGVLVTQGAYFQNLSNNNRIRTEIIHAPRGTIFDRNGKPLVYNVPGYRETINGKTKLLTQQEAVPLLAKGDKNLEIDSLRNYPYKDISSHVLGYLGQISPEELKTEDFSDYLATDLVGEMGLERQYGRDLRGIDGKELFEVDAIGNPVRKLGITDPIPGKNIKTTVS